MAPLRVAIVGSGGMGRFHARNLVDGKVPGAELAALCDTDPAAFDKAREFCRADIPTFDSADKLFAAKCVDAVVIATPHYEHPSLSIAALKSGHHVMCEKPAGVYTRQVRELNEVADRSDRIFGVMFNQRPNPAHRKLKDLLDSGELGTLKRNSWIITNWYRPQSYYDSGGWRATWGGEGGGVLVNQCPHNLDLWQWFLGVPKRIRAFCSFGKYHHIEVEDDVTAYAEYENGMTGTFITSTGEAPGSNRFEVAGDRGKIVMEDGKLVFHRNRVPERQFNAEYKGGFGQPECWRCEIPAWGEDPGHVGVLRQWVKAIDKKDPSLLVARGQEGIRNVEIANAMLLSAWIDDWVTLPVDEGLFYTKLQEKIATSTFVKKTAKMAMKVDGTF